jgi:hypothetical protein
VYPPGLVVGRVTAVQRQTSGMFLNAGILPAVNFGKVEEVVVLAPQPAAAFPTTREPGPPMKLALTLVLTLLFLALESVAVKYVGLGSPASMSLWPSSPSSLRAGLLEGAAASYGVGYLLDLMTGRPTGLYTLLAVITFLLGRIAGRWWTCVPAAPSHSSPWRRTRSTGCWPGASAR